MSTEESGRAAPAAPPRQADQAAAALPARLLDEGAAALVAALGHVLRQNEWARAKLAMFAGRVVRIGIDAPALPGLPPPQLLARIVEAGLLEREQRGKWAYFSLKRDAVEALAAVADLKGACC